MTARDRWTDDLKCPKCGKVGKAELSHADGWSFTKNQSTSIDSVTEGFRAQTRPNSNLLDFYCIDCGEYAG